MNTEMLVYKQKETHPAEEDADGSKHRLDGLYTKERLARKRYIEDQ